MEWQLGQWDFLYQASHWNTQKKTHFIQGWMQDDFWGGLIWSNYHTYSTYSDRQAWANIVDPDQMPQNAASDQGLHCLPLSQQFYTHSKVVKWTCWRGVEGKAYGVWIFKVKLQYPKFIQNFSCKWHFESKGILTEPQNPSESATHTVIHPVSFMAWYFHAPKALSSVKRIYFSIFTVQSTSMAGTYEITEICSRHG